MNEKGKIPLLLLCICLGLCTTHLSCKNGMSLKLYFHLIKKKKIIFINANDASNIGNIKKLVRFSFTNVHPGWCTRTLKPIAINSVSHTDVLFYSWKMALHVYKTVKAQQFT